MPKYSIRRFYQYCDEYVVEAADEHEADEAVDAALDGAGKVIEDNEHGVTQVAENEYVDYECTYVTELDTQGAWIGEPIEL